MTYLDHPDTDIIVTRDIGGNVRDSLLARDQLRSLVRNKSRLVAWVVSNCREMTSLRRHYVNELSRHVPVDVYGRCGRPCNDTWLSMTCFRKLERRYKFYLAFENSICTDYVTEKLYRTLSLYLVPIVLTGADITNSNIPPHSYIDVRHFRSPRQLADYLRHLDENEAEYMAYFDWKYSYQEKPSRHPFCKLCDILHDKHFRYKTNFDPASYWNPDKCCIYKKPEVKKLLGLRYRDNPVDTKRRRF